jgi:hypothetical protein
VDGAVEPAGGLGGRDVDDDELTALALAADPSAPLADDATAWLATPMELLPEWYMAPTAGRSASRGRRLVALALAAGLVGGCALGLCVTSGWVQIA